MRHGGWPRRGLGLVCLRECNWQSARIREDLRGPETQHILCSYDFVSLLDLWSTRGAAWDRRKHAQRFIAEKEFFRNKCHDREQAYMTASR